MMTQHERGQIGTKTDDPEKLIQISGTNINNTQKRSTELVVKGRVFTKQRKSLVMGWPCPIEVFGLKLCLACFDRNGLSEKMLQALDRIRNKTQNCI